MAFVGPLEPETVNVGATPVGITTRPGDAGMKASAALIVVEDAPIRYWLGEVDPGGSDGIPVAAGGVIELHDFGSVRSFAAVRSTGVSAKLRVQPFIGW